MRTKEQQALFEQGLKQCCACGRILPRSDFPNPDARGRCRECRNEYARNASKRRYRDIVLGGGERLARMREYGHQYYLDHKEQMRAYNYVYYRLTQTNSKKEQQ